MPAGASLERFGEKDFVFMKWSVLQTNIIFQQEKAIALTLLFILIAIKVPKYLSQMFTYWDPWSTGKFMLEPQSTATPRILTLLNNTVLTIFAIVAEFKETNSTYFA